MRHQERNELRKFAKELCDKYKIDDMISETKNFNEGRFTMSEIESRFCMKVYSADAKFKYE